MRRNHLQKLHVNLGRAAANMKDFIIKFKKPLIITISVLALQLIFGFDPKFSVINIIWLFV